MDAESERSRYHLGQLMLDNLAQNPTGICQIDSVTGLSETRGSLRQRSIKFAQHMLKLGLKVNDTVTICSGNHNDACLPLLAGFQIGVTTNALDMILSKFECKHMLKIIRPKMIFCELSNADMFNEIRNELGIDAKIVTFGNTIDKRFISAKEFYENDYSTENYKVVDFDTRTVLAFIICSSGSTGFPKGVCHTHKATKIRIDGMKPYFDHDRALQFASIYWVSFMLMTVLSATINVVRVNSPPCTPAVFFEVVKKYNVEVANITPPILKVIMNHPDFETADLSALKKIFLGGSAVNPDVARKLQKRLPGAFVMNGYGTTESGGPVTIVPKGMPHDPSSVGQMHPWVMAKLIDVETGKLITEPNKPGELYLKGEVMTAGYYNDPEATAEVIDADGWHATGDLCKMDENQFIYIVDRLKEMFKYIRSAIAPAMIEHVINEVPGVAQSAVIGVPDDYAGHVPMAFVKRSPGSTVTADDVKQAVKDQLASYCELRGGVAFVDSFAMSTAGKIKRAELKKIISTSRVE